MLVCRGRQSGDEDGPDEVPESMHAGTAYARLGEASHATRKLPAGNSLEAEFGTDHPDEGASAQVVEVSRAH